MEENKKNNSVMHVASLALGIVSIVACSFWWLALPTGILAIIFGVKSAKRTGSRIGKAGMITGIVGLSLFAMLYGFMIVLLTVAASI